MGDTFKNINNSTIVSRSKIDGSLEKSAGSSRAGASASDERGSEELRSMDGMKEWGDLFDLLKEVFDKDALEAFIRAYPGYEGPARQELVDSLPDTAVNKNRYFMDAANTIREHGIDDQAFFDRMAAVRPSHKDRILATAKRYLGPTRADQSPVIRGVEPSRDGSA